jgi:RNA polymerase sigma-70 factor, ECF subfamily
MAVPVDDPDADDVARFDRFYVDHYEDVLAYALRRTDGREDALDAVAETFLTAWRRRDQLRDATAAKLWLFGIARRVVANQVRGQRRRDRLGARLRSRSAVGAGGGAGPAAAGGSGADVAGVVERGPVVDAWNRLRAEDREILTLTAVEGLSAAQAAQVWGGTVVAARVRLHRARARFARELRAAGVTPPDGRT